MSDLKTRDGCAGWVYIFFLLLWIALCWTSCSHNLYTTSWVWIPFGAGIVYLAFAGVHAYFWPLIEEPDRGRRLLEWITNYLVAFVLAITLIMLVAVYSSLDSGKAYTDVIQENPSLLAFYRFEFISLGFIFLFVLPTYWFGSSKHKQEKWLRATRHIKTAAYLIAIFCCLAGFAELAAHFSLI